MESKTALLEVQNLRTIIYSEEGLVRAVDGVNLTVREGEIVGLVGESGCGKSMTARSIVRLLPNAAKIVEGKILFRGIDLLTQPEAHLNKIRGKELSIVFQDPMTFLNPLMKIGQQIAEPLRLHEGLSKADARAESINILSSMDLGDAAEIAENYPHQFSGGMKQRVLLAIALSCKPSLLIADEPFTAVDISVQNQLIFLLQEMHRALNFSLLLITHDLAVTAELCDRTYVMYAGEIAESGDVYTIYKQPKHPYTKALIESSTFDRRPNRGSELPFIPGTVPSMLNPPTGCRFHPRCPYALERCSKDLPVATDIKRDHWVRCWLYE